MANWQRVYISSTNRDTDVYRLIARDATLQLGMFPVIIDNLPATAQSVMEALQQGIEEADIFVGIYVYRYGYIPQGHEKSYLHMEYEWAKERGMPCLLFMINDDRVVPPEFDQPEALEKLRAFKRETLNNYVVSFFSSEDDFRSKFILALANAKAESASPASMTLMAQTTKTDDRLALDEDTLTQIINRTITIYEARQQVEVQNHPEHPTHPDAIWVEPIFGMPRKDPQYDCNVFAIMPFDPKLKPVYDYVMKPVCQDLNMVIKRGDDFFAPHPIIDEIWTAIFRSQLVIVDATLNKPNVYYELGMAHTLGKPAIVITQTPDEMPFDIRALRFIAYTDTGAGFEKLKGELKDAIIKIMNRQP